MAEYREATPDQAQLLDELVAAGHLIPSGVPGVYGRGSVFEDVRERFDAHVTRAAAAEVHERDDRLDDDVLHAQLAQLLLELLLVGGAELLLGHLGLLVGHRAGTSWA